MRFRGWIAAAALLAVPVAGLSAQDPDGYLLGQPRMTVVLKGLFDQPRAQSELFDFTTDLLTMERGDFSSLGGGVSIHVRLVDHLDVGLDVTTTSSQIRSEFRDYVEETPSGQIPIEQTTSYDRTTIALNARVFPLARGRAIGSFAWIPTTVSPYLGGGVGRTSYRFVQEGDFVDEQTLDIFEDYLQTEGAGMTTHAFAGVEIGLGPRFLTSIEGRYTWGALATGGNYGTEYNPGTNDFIGFDDVDQNAFQFAVGFGVRF